MKKLVLFSIVFLGMMVSGLYGTDSLTCCRGRGPWSCDKFSYDTSFHMISHDGTYYDGTIGGAVNAGNSPDSICQAMGGGYKSGY